MSPGSTIPVTGEDGWPEQERGVVPSSPGLYFLGLPLQYAFASMLVGGAGRDAKYVANHIGAAMRAAAGRATGTGPRAASVIG